MESNPTEIRIEGKTFKVPSMCINGRTVIVTGKWIKVASIHDEDLVEGDPVENSEAFVSCLKRSDVRADIFAFAQPLSATRPKHPYRMEWDNAAVIPTRDYKEWWEKRLPQETRRNVRRAAKMGVTTRVVPFDDELVKGIVEIYDETPVRQGRSFWHYGKDFETVKRESGTYPERSEFIGAYCENRLVGFCKLIYADHCAKIIHILSRNDQADKRPTNALIARAVELSVEKGMTYLTYCKYVYGKNDESPLTEFKRRNGFEPLLYPRYFVPLTWKGRIVLALKLHHGLKNLLPKRLMILLLELRAKLLRVAHRKAAAAAESSS